MHERAVFKIFIYLIDDHSKRKKHNYGCSEKSFAIYGIEF